MSFARGLDHIVHAVSDLDAAAAFYARAGFTVGARNRHPPAWGTQNNIVQLPGCFVELLAMADTGGIVPHGARHFSFGAFNRDFLMRGQGLSVLVVEGKDSAAEAQAFRAVGIGDFDLFDFARDAKRPDGMPTKVAFTLAFARDAAAPDIGFFTCRQHYPENFWDPAFQSHANGVTGIAGIVLVAERPQDHRAFLRAFTSADVTAAPTGIMARTPRGDIDVMEPASFTRCFGVAPPDTARGARLAALRFAVADRTAARAALERGKVGFSEQSRQLVVGPDLAFGATLVFEGAP
jgi:Glyoxalase-like domain